MRGEPPPRLQDDYWALGVLSPWRMDDAVRAAERDRAGGRAAGFDADGGFTSRRGGTKVRWDRLPVMWEWEIRDETNGMTTDDEDDSIIEKRAMGVDMVSIADSRTRISTRRDISHLPSDSQR